MQIAAITSHAALTVSPRLSATIPNDTAPNATMAAHSNFVCMPFRVVTSVLIAPLPCSAIAVANDGSRVSAGPATAGTESQQSSKFCLARQKRLRSPVDDPPAGGQLGRLRVLTWRRPVALRPKPDTWSAEPAPRESRATGALRFPSRARPALSSTIQGDADHAAKVAFIGALLGVARDVDLALGRAVAIEARADVILRHGGAMGGTALGLEHRREWLILRPGRQQQLLPDHFAFPIIRSRPGIANQLVRRGHLHLGVAGSAAPECLVHQSAEHRRNESLETDALPIDRLLVRVDDLDDGIHLHAKQLAVPRRGIQHDRVDTGGLPVDLGGLRAHGLAIEALVAKARGVDQ